MRIGYGAAKRVRLLTATAAIVWLGSAAAAQAQVVEDNGVTPAAPSGVTTDKDASDIVVIGTRRTDRTLANSASPVDVISSNELTSQPTSNMLDTLKNLIPSFFVPQNTISDASSFVRAPSLRGLPGDEVLVMLDGKRYNRSALVQVYTGGDTGLSFGSQGSDISAIPEIAISNLQVLRDGATAQYGSDAIAGVLNYGLKDADHGIEAYGRYGEYYQNGDGKSKQVALNVGLPLFGLGFVNLSGEYDDNGQTSRGATRPLAVIFAERNPSLAAELPNYPLPAQIWGSSPSHGYKLLGNVGINVTADSQLYGFVNVAHSRTNESFNYRSPISASATDITGVSRPLSANGAFRDTFYLTPCPAGNATCPAGGFVNDNNTFNFTSIYPAGFTPRFVGVTDQAYGVVGYKGHTDSGFRYDVSGSVSRNALDLSMYDSLSPSYGPQSQTSFKFGKLIQREKDANIDLSYPLSVGLSSPLTISVGGEYRHESYQATAGDLQSYGVGPYTAPQQLYTQTAPGVYVYAGQSLGASPGASGYGGTSPGSAGKFGQNSFAFYADLETDLTSRLSVGLAGRYEHYDTFGGTAVGKFNAIYRITDGLSIRGTVGNGFHAPSPGQSNDEILTTNFVAGNQVQTGTYPVSSPIAQYYGAKTLKPESSTNFGVGIVAQPVRRLTITVDGYSIKVDDRIGISQNYTVTAADVAAQPALISVGVGGNINYFTNAFDTLTRGVDLVSTYHATLSQALADFTLAYSYNESKVTRYDSNTISQAQIVDVARLAPRHRVNFNTVLTLGNLQINGRENYYSSWRDEVDYPGQVFGSKFVTDLSVSYSILKAVSLTVGANNLLDVRPDRIAQSSSNPVYQLTGSLADGQIYPRSGGPFGINGGFWYVQLRVKY